MHARDALAGSESAARVALIAAWRESQYFTGKERSALAVTQISDGQIPDAVYAEAAGALSPEEIAAVEWLAIVKYLGSVGASML